jgi:hypothetical protein
MCIIFNQSCGLEKEPSVEYFRKKASIIKASMKLKTKITTLTEHFQISIEKSMVEAKSTPQTHKYITIHFPGLLKAFQSNVAGLR